MTSNKISLSAQRLHTRMQVLRQAREYVVISNEIGAIAASDRSRKEEVLKKQLFPMYHNDIDMFGTIGRAAVEPAVAGFFVDTFKDMLRFDTVIGGTIRKTSRVLNHVDSSGRLAAEVLKDSAALVMKEGSHEPEDEQLVSQFFRNSDDDLTCEFEFVRSWRDESTGKTMWTSGAEEIEFVPAPASDTGVSESDVTSPKYLLKRIAYIKEGKPTAPAEITFAPSKQIAGSNASGGQGSSGAYVVLVSAQFPDARNRDLWLGAVDALKQHVDHYEADGCLAFQVAFDQKDALKVVLYERYRSLAVFEEQHKKSDAFRAFVDFLQKYVKREVSASYLLEQGLYM